MLSIREAGASVRFGIRNASYFLWDFFTTGSLVPELAPATELTETALMELSARLGFVISGDMDLRSDFTEAMSESTFVTEGTATVEFPALTDFSLVLDFVVHLTSGLSLLVISAGRAGSFTLFVVNNGRGSIRGFRHCLWGVLI